MACRSCPRWKEMELVLQFGPSCFYLCPVSARPSAWRPLGGPNRCGKKMVKNGILQLSGLQNVRTLSHGELMLCAFCLFDLYAIGQLRNTILDYVSPCFPVFFRGDRMCLKAGFQTSCLSISPLLLAIYSSWQFMDLFWPLMTVLFSLWTAGKTALLIDTAVWNEVCSFTQGLSLNLSKPRCQTWERQMWLEKSSPGMLSLSCSQDRIPGRDCLLSKPKHRLSEGPVSTTATSC